MTTYSLLPDTFSFIFLSGDTLNVEFTLVDDEDAPINLNQYTAIESQVRDIAGALIGDIIVIETDPVNGVFEIFLTEEISNQLQPGPEYGYDIQLIGTKTIDAQPHRTVSTISKGTLSVEEDITQDVVAVVGMGEVPKYTLHHRGS